MKSIDNFINEGAEDTKVNLIILDCGSMSDKKNDIETLINIHQKAHLWCTLYCLRNNKISKIDGFEDLEFSGPHSNLKVIQEFMENHATELTIFIGI